MKKTLITKLRDKNTGMAEFRHIAEKFSHVLANESFEYIKEKKKIVTTPFQKTAGHVLESDIVLIPILRAGLGFLPTFLYYFENAKVGFVGLKRDEKTATAHEYYKNLPKIGKKDTVIVLDPMIATGGSAVSTLESLKKAKVPEKNIIFVSLVATPQGLKKLKKSFPGIKIITGVKDKGLNKEKFILPGIGDFGDRYFGTM